MDPNVDALLWNGRAQESYGTEKIHGVIPAMVVAIDDKKEKRHRMGAVQIRFPWLMDPIARDILPWARCTTFASGQTSDACGWVSTPQIGDEVLVGFEDGDVHRPYVLGGLFNPTGGDGEKGDDDKDDDNEEKDDDKKDDKDDDKKCKPPPFVNVHFQLGYSKDEITDESELQLKVEDDEDSKEEVLGDLATLGRRLKEHGDYHYEVQGHADRSGDAGLNMDLSRRRAQSVIDYLIKNGAGGSQLKLTWYGETAPTVQGTADGVARDEDRRTECHLVSPKKCTCGKYTCPSKPDRPKPGGSAPAKPSPGEDTGGGQKPDQGGQKPDQGGQKPDQGGQKPDQGGQKPDQGGQKPDQGGQKPDQGGQDPDQDDDIPKDGELPRSPWENDMPGPACGSSDYQQRLVKAARMLATQKKDGKLWGMDCCWDWAWAAYCYARLHPDVGGGVDTNPGYYLKGPYGTVPHPTRRNNRYYLGDEDASLPIHHAKGAARRTPLPTGRYGEIKPGDWLWIYNANSYDAHGEHSVVFLEWVDQGGRIASTASQLQVQAGGTIKNYDFKECPVTGIWRSG